MQSQTNSGDRAVMCCRPMFVAPRHDLASSMAGSKWGITELSSACRISAADPRQLVWAVVSHVPAGLCSLSRETALRQVCERDCNDASLRLCMQDDAAPLDAKGLWHPLLLLGRGDAAGIRVQPNDLTLGG